jgi:hypothetical protein
MGYYDAIDLEWDRYGDFLEGDDGDLADTSSDLIIAKEQQIYSILRAQRSDYRSNPGFACGLEDFVGRPNTRETGKEIEERVKTTLIMNRIASAEDILIRVVPVRPDTVLLIGSVRVAPSPYNRLDDSNNISFSFFFDLPSAQLISLLPGQVNNYLPIGA